MGKDGSGGIGGSSESSSCNCGSRSAVQEVDIFTLHIETLKIIDNELNRLHVTLSNENNGDDDVTQEQITVLINELARLSEAFSDKECK